MAVVAVCAFAAWATGLPVMAAEESDEQAAIGTVWGGREAYEYSSLLIEWDREDGVYRSGDEEGSFAYLLSMPGAEGWEFVTILAESWFETSLDDRAAWDVFRWRVVLRRLWEPTEATEEEPTSLLQQLTRSAQQACRDVAVTAARQGEAMTVAS